MTQSILSADRRFQLLQRFLHRRPRACDIDPLEALAVRSELTELEVDTPHAAETFHQAEYDEEVRGIIVLVKKYAQKYGKSIPVVTAGGIYDHADVMHQMELGADGVQVATRFVTTEECDAPMAYKQAYLDAKEEVIVIVKSPVGMPGRAFKNAF